MANFEVLATHAVTYKYSVDADSPEEAAEKVRDNDFSEDDAEMIDEGEFIGVQVYKSGTLAPNLLDGGAK